MAREHAIWYPHWYELDQAIEVGCVGEFEFFVSPPEHLADEGVLVFFVPWYADNEQRYTARKRIVRIHHPRLGEIRGIDTRGLDYKFNMMEGPYLLVEAEETPGRVYGQPPIEDWRIYVEMEPA